MAFLFNTAGASSAGTTSLTLAYPASLAQGDILVMCITNKYPTNAPTVPSGWIALAENQGNGGAGAAGIDTGTVYATIFIRISDGTETGNVSVTITSGNSAVGVIMSYRSTNIVSQREHVQMRAGSDNAGGSTTVGSSLVNSSNIDFCKAGDTVVGNIGINGNAYTYTGGNFQAQNAVVTFTGHKIRSQPSTANGQDCGMCITEGFASAGATDGTWLLLHYATGSSSAASSPAGGLVMSTLREVDPPCDLNGSCSGFFG